MIFNNISYLTSFIPYTIMSTCSQYKNQLSNGLNSCFLNLWHLLCFISIWTSHIPSEQQLLMDCDKTVQVEGRKFRLLIMTYSLEAGLGSVPSPMSCTPPPHCLCHIKPFTIDLTPDSFCCLQTFAQAGYFLYLCGIFQLAAPTQGSTIISNLIPGSRFPRLLYAVTNFLQRANTCFPNYI